jgi:hypothetical protein
VSEEDFGQMAWCSKQEACMRDTQFKVKSLMQKQRKLITIHFSENSTVKQKELAAWAQTDFGISYISQSTISSIIFFP